MTATVKDRLIAKVQPARATGCWLWMGCLNSRGYGVISVAGERKLAHRVSYELHVGPIPDGLTIDHLCRVKVCVNPAHLEPVTMQENNHRAPHNGYGKTHCKRGHEYTEANTHVNGKGTRSCKACKADQQRARRATSVGVVVELPRSAQLASDEQDRRSA